MKASNFKKINAEEIKPNLHRKINNKKTILKEKSNGKNAIKNNPINKNSIKTNQKIFYIIISISILLLLSTIAFAIPNSLTLQGKLTNLAGASQSGTFNFTFRIYDAATGGNQLWASINQTVATDANGVYDVILQNINLSFLDQYYLGITIGSDSESTPRINLTSSPYSFRANVSEGLNANNSYVVTNLSIKGNTTIGTGETTLAISTQGFNLTTAGNIFAAGNLSIAGNTFFINSLTGYIGIGTITPQNKLEVLGAVTVAGTLNASSINTTGSAYFATSGVGNVGIGTTSPAEKLVVIGNVNVSGTLNVSGRVAFPNVASQNCLGTDANGVLQASTCGSNANATGQFNSSGANIYPNETTSSLGFGTNKPQARIHINDSSAAGAFLITNVSGTTVLFVNGSSGTTSLFNYLINFSNNGDINFAGNLIGFGGLLTGMTTNATIEIGNIGGYSKLWNRANTTDYLGGINATILNGITNSSLIDTIISGLNNRSFTETAITSRNQSWLDKVLLNTNISGFPFSNFRLENVTNNTLAKDNNATDALWNISGSNIYPREFNGNVGINTTTPANTLTVQGTLNVTSNPTRNGDLIVAPNGNVGIAITTPSSTLQVVGTANITQGSTSFRVTSDNNIVFHLE